MPSRQLIPRIRVNLPDSSSCSLSPSSTLDIKDVLCQAKLLPKLLAEDFVFDDADDALYSEDSQGFPSFPIGRQLPLFILNPHRARLPFPIRPDAFELGDFCWNEEDVRPLLTAPTVPRMKTMIKEPLYVQKWVDTLKPDDPPKHIPWTCEKPATKRKWIAEGSIFPAGMVNFHRDPTEKRGTIQGPFCITSDWAPLTRESCKLPEAPAPIHASTESHTPTRHIRTKSADAVNPSTLRGELKTLHIPRCIVRTSRAQSQSSPSLPPSGADALLVARRGKSLSSLKLEGVIEHLEYPDIPTAFRGSPTFWSPRFDTTPIPSFTDHDNMLLDLRSKWAELGSGVTAYIQEPQTMLTRISPSVDEWAFTRGLATFDNSFLASVDRQVSREAATDTSVFPSDDSPTPVKGDGFTAHPGFVTRSHSTPASHSPGSHPSDPPGVPLPPRPALVNPSTPLHVRGILKKVKNVRFEDTTKGPEDLTLPVVAHFQVLRDRPSSVFAISCERPCTPMSNAANAPNGVAPVKEAPGKNTQRTAPKSQLPPKRATANEKLESTWQNVDNAPEPSKPTLVTTPAERLCRIARAKENASPGVVPRAQAKQRGPSIPEVDIRRGIEGTTKSRLSTPLRNIFKFR